MRRGEAQPEKITEAAYAADVSVSQFFSRAALQCAREAGC